MNKKAQAAMEFLANYGWAMIMIVLLGSAITYYTFDIEQSAQETCKIGESTCSAYAIIEGQNYLGELKFNNEVYNGIYGRVEFDILNPESNTINITNVEVMHSETELLVECDFLPIVEIGKKIELRCNLCKNTSGNLCTDFLGNENKDKLDISVAYTLENSVFTKYLKGEISSTVTDTSSYINECHDSSDNDGDGKTDNDDLACQCTPPEFIGKYEVEEGVCRLFENCDNTGDCVTPLICDGGKCKVAIGGNCDANKDCANTLICDDIEEICLKDILKDCFSNDDCANGRVCDSDKKCKVDIHDDCNLAFPSQCIINTFCELGKCLGDLHYSPCGTADPLDCLSALVCKDGECAVDTSCVKNEECMIAGQSCINNNCELKSELKGDCDPGDNADCNNVTLVCDSDSNKCLGAEGFFDCKQDNALCSEKLICPIDTCEDPRPLWCRNDNTMYWDETDNYCWVFNKSMISTDCTAICSSEGLLCIEDKWNDLNCEILSKFIGLGLGFGCTAIKDTAYPGYDTKTGTCHERYDSITQLCDSAIEGLVRLCACKEDITG